MIETILSNRAQIIAPHIITQKSTDQVQVQFDEKQNIPTYIFGNILQYTFHYTLTAFRLETEMQ